MRSTLRDGVGNRLEFLATTSMPELWRAAQRQRHVARLVNRTLINRAVSKVPPRPHPLSTSWLPFMPPPTLPATRTS